MSLCIFSRKFQKEDLLYSLSSIIDTSVNLEYHEFVDRFLLYVCICLLNLRTLVFHTNKSYCPLSHRKL